MIGFLLKSNPSARKTILKRFFTRFLETKKNLYLCSPNSDERFDNRSARNIRRGGRVAESTGLLNLHTGNRITSSNLVLSATQGQRFPAGLVCFYSRYHSRPQKWTFIQVQKVWDHLFTLPCAIPHILLTACFLQFLSCVKTPLALTARFASPSPCVQTTLLRTEDPKATVSCASLIHLRTRCIFLIWVDSCL